MHKLMEYICDELEQLERKADKEGKLSMAEIQYMDTLLHAKKNLLTAEAMSGEEDEEYSNAGGNYSYARGGGRGRGSNARRDSMGRYSRGGSYEGGRGGSYEGGGSNRGGSYEGGGGRGGSGGSYARGYSRDDAKEELSMQLQELKQDAQDEETKRMINKWIKQLEQE